MGSNIRGSPSSEKDQNINDGEDDIYGNKGYDEGYEAKFLLFLFLLEI